MNRGAKSKESAVFKFVAAIALLSASFAIFTLKTAGDKKMDKAYAKPKELVFKDLSRRFQDVRRVKITTPEGSFQFRNTNGSWVISERANYPLNTKRLNELALQLASLSIVALKSNDPGEFDTLGVGEPLEFGFGSIIEFFDSQDQTIDASHIGQKPDGIYVRRMGESKIRLAQGTLMEFTNIKQWPDYQFFKIEPAQIKSIGIENESGKARTINAVPNNEKTKILTDFIVSPNLIDVTTSTRIDAKPALKIKYELSDNSILRAGIYAQNGNYWVKYSALGENGAPTVFSDSLNSRASDWAFAIDKNVALKLLK